MDLAINNLQWLICHKTQPKLNQTKPTLHIDMCTHTHTHTHTYIYIYIYIFVIEK